MKKYFLFILPMGIISCSQVDTGSTKELLKDEEVKMITEEKNTIQPVTITDDNFQEVVMQSEIPVLIDFWATWCKPCLVIAPSVKELAKEYEGKAIIGKLDVDKNRNTASSYNIQNIPTMLIFKKGKVVETIVGANPKEVMQEKLNIAIQSN